MEQLKTSKPASSLAASQKEEGREPVYEGQKLRSMPTH